MASGSPPVQFSGEVANDDLDWFAKGSQLKYKGKGLIDESIQILILTHTVVPGSRHRANSLPNRPPNYCVSCRAAGAHSNDSNIASIQEEEGTDEPDNDKKTTDPSQTNQKTSETIISSNELASLQRAVTDVEADNTLSNLHRTLSTPASASRKTGWLHNLGQKFIGHKVPQQRLDSKTSMEQLSSPSSVVSSAVHHSSPRPIPARTDHVFADYASSSPRSCSPSTASLTGSYSASHEDISRGFDKSPVSSVTSLDNPRNGSFMSRLRRLSTRGPGTAEKTVTPSSGKVILNKRPNTSKCDVPELEGVLSQRVRFSHEVFENDPPQQIPSRHPKSGNILFKDNGEVVRTRPTNPNYILPSNYRLAAHTASTSAHETALRIAQTIKNGGINPAAAKLLKGKDNPALSSFDEDDKKSQEKTLMIDTPMSRKDTDDDTSSIMTDVQADDSLETIYTRCCHLREILPIPATIKQMKDKEAPLPSLKITNQKPTLIEILSFADFISIVPVVILQFDNCWLSNEMLEILLSSIANSSNLLMLSLRNVFLDPIGWKFLCAFLLKNRALSRLDISITSLKRRAKSSVDPMKFTRSDADWESFNRVLVRRNGIEELLINGCMIPNDALELLLNEGLSKSTKRLGLALNDLHIENLEEIRDWMLKPGSVVEGLDLGGNDLNSCLTVLSEIIRIPSLNFLSLNSCDLDDSKELHHLFVETSNDSHLRFMDLSGNPRLFPGFTKTLVCILPKIKGLRRIHLDSEDFTSQDVAKLCEAFARCSKLYHLSLLDNPKMDSTACAALSAAVQISSTLYTVELDSDQFPVEMRHRLAHYCILNMETLAGRMSESMRQQSFTLNFDDEKELMVTGTELAKAVSDILSNTKDDDDEEDLHYRQVIDTMVKRARQVRIIVQESLSDLVKKREKTQLSNEEKEIFLRFCLLDVTLEEILGRYKKLIKEANGITSNGSAPLSAAGEDSAIKLDPAITSHMLLVDRPNKQAGTPTHELKVSPMDEDHTRVSLSRNNSSSSLKKQEQEEGELLKLSSVLMRDKNQLEDDKKDKTTENGTKRPTFASGEELRQLYQRYKGNGTLSQLLGKLQEAYGTDFHEVLRKVTSEPLQSDNSEHQVIDKVIEDLARGLKKS